MLDIVFAVNGYVRGAAQLSAPRDAGPTLDVPAMVESGRHADYPHLMATLDSGYDNRSEDSFEFGLALLLDGVQRRLG